MRSKEATKERAAIVGPQEMCPTPSDFTGEPRSNLQMYISKESGWFPGLSDDRFIGQVDDRGSFNRLLRSLQEQGTTRVIAKRSQKARLSERRTKICDFRVYHKDYKITGKCESPCLSHLWWETRLAAWPGVYKARVLRAACLYPHRAACDCGTFQEDHNHFVHAWLQVWATDDEQALIFMHTLVEYQAYLLGERVYGLQL